MARILVIFLLFIFTPGSLPSVHAQESPPTSKADPDKAASSQFKRLTADELRAELPGNTFYSSHGWHFYVAPGGRYNKDGELYAKSNQNSSFIGHWYISRYGEFCKLWHHRNARFLCEKWGQQDELFEAGRRERCHKTVLRRVKGNPENYSPAIAKAAPQPLPAPLPPKDISYQAPSSDIPIEITSLLGKWEGDWDGELNSFLIVEKVDLEKARVVYGWGTYPDWNINRRGYTRRIANIIMRDNGPWLEIEDRWDTYSFHLSTDLRTLSGTYIFNIEMKKTAAPVFDAQGSAYVAAKRKTVAFVNVNILPMDQNKVLASQTVIVQDGRIAQIGPMNQVKIPKSAEIVQGEGKAFLMPGLADMHVHITEGNDLRLLIANGVTTVRNMSGEDKHLLFRNDVKEGRRVGPMIYSTGPLLGSDPPIWRGSRVIVSVEEAREVVIETKKRGFDFIKVYSRLRPEVYATIVETAKKHNLPVVGHVPYDVGFASAVEAGQYSVEHLFGASYAMRSRCENEEQKNY